MEPLEDLSTLEYWCAYRPVTAGCDTEPPKARLAQSNIKVRLRILS
jgi:hypothetical protein